MMLRYHESDMVYFFIDALYERRSEEPGLPQILQLVTKTLQVNNKVRWLISSRHIPEPSDSTKEASKRPAFTGAQQRD
ncbi:hypothetical protein BD289DRAFT_430072 [Coniella lustricola]|uniref:NACHT domain-containing protein n=1 Tax=Coniella lustricola TaxID=2025994 RepID=A0A2T3ACA6_9PEZI|nr:hypothetical protein BD289DRAFT_430072 [Coniella lustricola]